MSEFNKLKRKQISDMLQKGEVLQIEKLGQRLKDIRDVLGMTQSQMARRLRIKQPTLSKIEENIENSKLSTVIRICNALNCEFRGAILAKSSLEAVIKERATKIAEKTLKRTYANMAMEEQAPNKAAYRDELIRITDEFMTDPGPELWED